MVPVYQSCWRAECRYVPPSPDPPSPSPDLSPDPPLPLPPFFRSQVSLTCFTSVFSTVETISSCQLITTTQTAAPPSPLSCSSSSSLVFRAVYLRHVSLLPPGGLTLLLFYQSVHQFSSFKIPQQAFSFRN